MTIQKLLRKFNKYHPKTIQKIRRLHISVKYISNGAFRQVYKVKNLPVVIKVPKTSFDIYHAQKEICKLKQYSKTKVAKFIPKLYYTNVKTGIIICQYCPSIKEIVRKINRLVRISDTNPDNIGYNCQTKQFKVLDLGL